MKYLSLFAGIGGFDLGLDRAGMTCIGQVELDDYCRGELAKQWPDVPRHDDIRTFDESVWSTWEHPDVICGGYPCQPFSLAGRRGGEDDPRHLWPEFARTIREIRPRIALLENVPGHTSLGFGRVLGDLAEMGYDAEWACFPASALGAWHKRNRLFVIAYTGGDELREQSGRRSGSGRQGPPQPRVDGTQESMANTNVGGRERGESLCSRESSSKQSGEDVPNSAAMQREAIERNEPDGVLSDILPDAKGKRVEGRRASGIKEPPASPRERLFRRDCAGKRTDYWNAEPSVGRVADGIPNRVAKLKALGNAIVPQCAEYVGRCVMKAFA